MLDPNFVPPGMVALERWARSRGLGFEARPDQDWFRGWEPFDTMISPAGYFGACTWAAPPGQVTLVEPWTELDGIEPMDRTVFAMVKHPGLRHRVSLQSGDHFITRVAFLTDPPPPVVELGDATWDENVTTRALSADEARAAITPALRETLRHHGFRGHLELRVGAAVLHVAGLRPLPEGYQQLMAIAPTVIDAALR